MSFLQSMSLDKRSVMVTYLLVSFDILYFLLHCDILYSFVYDSHSAPIEEAVSQGRGSRSSPHNKPPLQQIARNCSTNLSKLAKSSVGIALLVCSIMQKQLLLLHCHWFCLIAGACFCWFRCFLLLFVL